jgi:hypothetical protein
MRVQGYSFRFSRHKPERMMFQWLRYGRSEQVLENDGLAAVVKPGDLGIC